MNPYGWNLNPMGSYPSILLLLVEFTVAKIYWIFFQFHCFYFVKIIFE